MRPPGLPSLALLAVALLLGAGAAACGLGARGVACSAREPCDAGAVCVVGLCRSPDAAPTGRTEARRVVIEPEDVAVISSSGGGGPRPDAFALGRAGAGTVELLVRFAAPWGDDAEIAFAFVVLEPAPGAAPAATPARVSFAEVLEPWSSDSITWGRQPRLGSLDAAGLIRATGRTPARVDVTRVVRAWKRRASSQHGIALVADGSDGFGGVFALGFGAGQGPRLEAYLR